MNKLHCLRCKHTWLPKSDAKPKVCPRCKSYSYDKPYIRKPEGA
jgi:predicted Zn-ribbon and HTH transcriptional regulator